ncbi:hypothetical protein BXZ70DRAFT_463944 [Cristinia sonorae]|uniref:DUF6535 domain-containing protein n=1 Tax=Cristinia sonorae TaxID=1940300 RepID=A0A8K0UHK4_9AGAR|nr:hypothetical protein BXZ70DRAFT_463944 [Cristinia sonorae]
MTGTPPDDAYLPRANEGSQITAPAHTQIEMPPPKDSFCQSYYHHGADQIWFMYDNKAKTYDKTLVHRLQSSMDSILVFAGLFSAIVTAFIIESYKQLRPDTGDITVFYLARISQGIDTMISPTGASGGISSAAPAKVDNPNIVAVNTLWVLSLTGSLICALCATFLQAWTNRYQHVISQSPDVSRRTRLRAWYFEGLTRSHMPQLAAIVPAVLHVSLFLFLVGLVLFFLPIDDKIAHTAIGATSLCCTMYLIFALLDYLLPNTPYRTPLSLILVVVYSAIVVVTVVVFVMIPLYTILTVVMLGFLESPKKHYFGWVIFGTPQGLPARKEGSAMAAAAYEYRS